MITFDIDEAALDNLVRVDGAIYLETLADRAYAVSQVLVPQLPKFVNNKGYVTGHLKASGAVEQDGEDWVVAYHTDYAVYVEEGTRNMTPEPYLKPALLEVVK